MFVSDYEIGEMKRESYRVSTLETTASRPATTHTPLEMQIHLTNGSTVRFVQPNQNEAEELIAGIHPNQFFRKPQLLLSGSNSLTAIPSAAVEEVTLQTELFPVEWSLPAEVADVVEFSPEAMISREGRVESGNGVEIFGEFEMRSGRIIYTRVTLVPPPNDLRLVPMDRDRAFLHFLDRAVLFGRRVEGGIFLLNPANVVRMTNFAPPSMHLIPDKVSPAGALPAGQFFS